MSTSASSSSIPLTSSSLSFTSTFSSSWDSCDGVIPLVLAVVTAHPALSQNTAHTQHDDPLQSMTWRCLLSLLLADSLQPDKFASLAIQSNNSSFTGNVWPTNNGDDSTSVIVWSWGYNTPECSRSADDVSFCKDFLHLCCTAWPSTLSMPSLLWFQTWRSHQAWEVLLYWACTQHYFW